MEKNENRKQYRGFNRGWQELKVKDRTQAYTQIIAILGVTTRASFCNYKNGKSEPKASEYDAIAEVFKAYGVKATSIWD